jgi:predicted metalloendopeptidase
MLSGQCRKLSTVLPLIISGLLISACTTVETQSFRTTGNSNVDSAYIATDADFSKYNRLLVDDMGIFFPDSVQMSEGELARIRQIFRESFEKELTAYEITQEPGPGMLRITASLVDLRGAMYADIPNMRREMRDIAQPGALLFLMEMKDSGTDQVLARAGDSASAPQFSTGSNGETDWESVEAAAQRWAALFRGFLDQNLGR